MKINRKDTKVENNENLENEVVDEQNDEELETVYEINEKVVKKNEQVTNNTALEGNFTDVQNELSDFIKSLTADKFEKMSDEFAKRWVEDKTPFIEMIDKFVEKRMSTMTGKDDLKKLGDMLSNLL